MFRIKHFVSLYILSALTLGTVLAQSIVFSLSPYKDRYPSLLSLLETHQIDISHLQDNLPPYRLERELIRSFQDSYRSLIYMADQEPSEAWPQNPQVLKQVTETYYKYKAAYITIKAKYLDSNIDTDLRKEIGPIFFILKNAFKALYLKYHDSIFSKKNLEWESTLTHLYISQVCLDTISRNIPFYLNLNFIPIPDEEVKEYEKMFNDLDSFRIHTLLKLQSDLQNFIYWIQNSDIEENEEGLETWATFYNLLSPDNLRITETPLTKIPPIVLVGNSNSFATAQLKSNLIAESYAKYLSIYNANNKTLYFLGSTISEH